MKKILPPLYVPKAEGGYQMSPAGTLVIAAHTFYRLQHENSPERVENAKVTMQEILAAARRARYGLVPQLSSALASGECTYRLGKMANEACAKVPPAEMREILARATFC